VSAVSAQIFISYRRSDADGHAGRVYDRLAQRFDDSVLFYDRQSIDAGDLFPERLDRAVREAAVVLVLIGPSWFAELNRRAGRTGTDWVRSEIELALALHARHGKPKIVPVLMGGASAPEGMAAAPLRPMLAALSRFDAHELRGKNDDWSHQFERLLGLVAAAPGVPAPRTQLHPGAGKPFRTVDHLRSAHFLDPQEVLPRLARALEIRRTVALSGMGGVGKTQLALAYSHSNRDRYAGIWWLRSEMDETLQMDARAACVELGVAIPEGEPPVSAMKRGLRGQSRPWLLVFDNASEAAAVRSVLPEGDLHHVLITSRNPNWGGIAESVAVAPWGAGDGADFLLKRLPEGRHEVLTELATLLGGLPLALEQAAGFLEATRMDPAEYLKLARNYETAPLLLDEGRAATGYERSVFATLSIAFERLDEVARRLLRLCAVLAPEPIPEAIFRDGAEHLPEPMRKALEVPLRWARAIADLRQYGIAERVDLPGDAGHSGGDVVHTLHLHRLTQQVARARLCEIDKDVIVATAVLYEALPADVLTPGGWTAIERLVPHVFHVDGLSRDGAPNAIPRAWLLDRVASFLQERFGSFDLSVSLFERVVRMRRETLGEERAETLSAMSNLADSLSRRGDLAAARTLQTRVLEMRERILGEKHTDTLSAATNLGSSLWQLGMLAEARALQERVLALRRETDGDENLDTIAAMNNLATTLGALGAQQEARALEERAVELLHRTVGAEHPYTLSVTNNLAESLRAEGELQAALDLHGNVRELRRTLLGDHHPNTLISTGNFASTLAAMGRLEEAEVLRRDLLDIQLRVLGERHPHTLTSMSNLAGNCWQLGRSDEAIALMERVVQGRTEVLGFDHPQTRDATATLAELRTRNPDRQP
jgi:hypothetical protein